MRKITNPLVILLSVVMVSCAPSATVASDDTTDAAVLNSASAGIQAYFNEQLREGVMQRVGQPIEGFVPFMFLQEFSGLVPEDFDGVEALLGNYEIVDNELTFVVDTGSPRHSAAEAISDAGMQTVFSNLQKRSNVLLVTKQQVDGLLLSLRVFPNPVITECLPGQRKVDVCIEIYQPVCANVNVQCVTTPCYPVQETFANSCKACSNPLVGSYADGACPVDR